MAGNSVYVQAALTNWFRGTVMPTAPVTMELALSTVSLNDAGSNLTEPSGTDGYARQAITLVAPVHTEGQGTRVANVGAIIFGPVTNNSWGTIVAAAVLDQAGNVLFHGDLAAPRAAPVGDTMSWGIETLEFKVK